MNEVEYIKIFEILKNENVDIIFLLWKELVNILENWVL